MIRFSIVIPVYKVEAYLDECVRSVLCQTYKNFQVILVDDGSPDRSGAMCDAWAVQDSRITVVHQENGGLSAARNTGIRHARGEYVLFLDSDDWWADERVLEKLNDQLVKTPVDVLSFNYRKSYDGKPEPHYFAEFLPSSAVSESLEQMLQGGCWVTGACNKAVRREILEARGLFFRTGITSEDIDWTLRLALAADRFAFANVCVFVYRQHGASLSHSGSLRGTMHLCGNVRECVRLLENAEPGKAELLKPFVAYQYGTLLHNVAQLDPTQRSKALMAEVRNMAWLLDCSNDAKIRLLRISNRFLGMNLTLKLLRLRQKILVKSGKGV